MITPTTPRKKRPISLFALPTKEENPVDENPSWANSANVVQSIHLKLRSEAQIMASKRELVKMKSTKSDFFYYTEKNKTSTPERITLKKYDPTLRQHVDFKETK